MKVNLFRWNNPMNVGLLFAEIFWRLRIFLSETTGPFFDRVGEPEPQVPPAVTATRQR